MTTYYNLALKIRSCTSARKEILENLAALAENGVRRKKSPFTNEQIIIEANDKAN